MLRLAITVMIFCTLVVSPPATASYFNLDFDAGNGAPSDTFGAGDVPGIWNAVGVASPATELLDLIGRPSGVTVEVFSDVGFIGFTETDQQTTTGDDALLLRDYAFSTSTHIRVHFEGLIGMPYAVTTYTVGRQDFPASSEIWLDDDLAHAQTVSGLWNGAFEVGVTHALHTLVILDGTLDVHIESTSDAIVNGIQIVPIPAPGAALLLLAGLVGQRLRQGRATDR